MCFYNDYDFLPEVYDVEVKTARHTTRCDECGCVIHRGQWLKHIWYQQYENPRNGVLDEVKDEYVVPEGEEPDHGETFQYDRCEACDKLLRAIEQVEKERGCGTEHALPGLEELHEAMMDGEDPEQYADRARELWPELALSGHLGRFDGSDPRSGWKGADLEPVEVYGGEA